MIEKQLGEMIELLKTNNELLEKQNELLAGGAVAIETAEAAVVEEEEDLSGGGETEDVPSEDDVIDAVKAAVDMHGAEPVKAVLAKYKAKRGTDVAEDDRAAFIEELEAIKPPKANKKK